MTAIAKLASSDEKRQAQIAEVLTEPFAELIESDEAAFRRKFRKMAADPFAFYRGSAHLFYADMDSLGDDFADKKTSRVWIQGDLHAENFGTYMSSDGVLLFDVNDFDEAYLGHFTWDLRRFAASAGLLGFSKALSDETVGEVVRAFAESYLEQVRDFTEGDPDDEFRLVLDNTEGPVHEVLLDARLATRIDMLQEQTTVEGHDRRFRGGSGVRKLEADEQGAVYAAYQSYLGTIPDSKRHNELAYKVKDVVGRSGFGIGSAGLPAYNLLVEGQTEALENDVILSMKQANVPAISHVISDKKIADYFEHQGHRTAVSQRALQAHADPWLGWCELDGEGFVVSELSPYEADLDWDDVTEPSEILPLVRSLGQATAKIHCVSDAGSEQSLVSFQTEEAIMNAVDGRESELASELAEFGAAYAHLVRDDHRRFVDAFRNGSMRGVSAD